MGYCIRMTCVKFTIKDANKKAALKAILDLRGKETIKDSYGRHFSFVNDFSECGTLESALEAWRYDPKTDAATGDITKITFTGEKYGDCKLLFTAIAPYVEAGSLLEYTGEDGDKWRYTFDGKTMKEVRPKVTWEEE